MSEAERYIELVSDENGHLCDQHALMAVEIAKEEMIERACDAYCKVCGHYAHTTPTHICRHACDYYSNFKQAMKDEQGRR